MKRILFSLALLFFVAGRAPAQVLSTQTGTVGPLLVGLDFPFLLMTGYKAFTGDQVQFMAFGSITDERLGCVILDFWGDSDSAIWTGWSDEIPVVTIPYSSLWTMGCMAEPRADFEILDPFYVLAAVKLIERATVTRSGPERSFEAEEFQPVNPAMVVEILERFLEK